MDLPTRLGRAGVVRARSGLWGVHTCQAAMPKLGPHADALGRAGATSVDPWYGRTWTRCVLPATQIRHPCTSGRTPGVEWAAIGRFVGNERFVMDLYTCHLSLAPHDGTKHDPVADPVSLGIPPAPLSRRCPFPKGRAPEIV